MAKIVNLTPHAVTICDADGNITRTIPAGPVWARLKASTVPAGEADGIPLSRTVYGQPTGLPDMEPGTFYVVSQLVKAALPDRGDRRVPAEVVRDDAGNIIGCRSLGV